VHAAEESNVGLIADLFWKSYAVPDLVGEPRGQWGNAQSKTRQFMRTYIREVVSRYVNSPAIWGWEFGNEYNLSLDSPDAWRNLPPQSPPGQDEEPWSGRRAYYSDLHQRVIRFCQDGA
jgi:hypothetical protein